MQAGTDGMFVFVISLAILGSSRWSSWRTSPRHRRPSTHVQKSEKEGRCGGVFASCQGMGRQIRQRQRAFGVRRWMAAVVELHVSM